MLIALQDVSKRMELKNVKNISFQDYVNSETVIERKDFPMISWRTGFKDFKKSFFSRLCDYCRMQEHSNHKWNWRTFIKITRMELKYFKKSSFKIMWNLRPFLNAGAC